MRQFAGWTFLALSTLSCRTLTTTEDQSATLGKTLSARYLAPAEVSLGMGVDSDLAEARDVCITNTNPDKGEGNTAIQYSVGQISQSTQESYGLNLGLDAKATYMDVVSGTLKGDFKFGKTDTDGTYTIGVAATYQTGLGKVTDSSLNAQGKGVQKDGNLFRRKCGNTYVKNVTYGGRLVASVMIEFQNHEKKVEFSNTVGLSGSMTPKLKGDVSRTIGFTWGRTDLWDKVTVSISQIGGDLGLISSILGTNTQNGKAMVECSAKAFDKCREYIEKILNAPEAYKAFVAKPTNISYQIATYPDRPGVPMSPEGQKKRQALVEALERNREDGEVISGLLSNSNVIGWHRKAVEERIKPIVDRNIKVLSNALAECDNPTYTPAPPCPGPGQVTGYSSYFGRNTPYLQAPEVQGNAGHLGNIDGNPRTQQACSGYFVGVAGKHGDSLDKSGFICQGPSDLPILGEGHWDFVASQAKKVYFDGEHDFKVYCNEKDPNNWVITGLKGSSEEWRGWRVVGSLGLWCTHINVLKGLSKDPNLTNRFVPVFGIGGGSTQSARCAPQFAVKSLDVWYGALIDGIRVDCVKVPKGF